MKIKPTTNNQLLTDIKIKLGSSNKNLSHVTKSNLDSFTFSQPNGDEVTYDLKSIRGQSTLQSNDAITRDMSYLGAKMGLQHSIHIDMATGAQTYGELNGKDNIDDFNKMRDRLGVEQSDKISYLTPSEDWLNLSRGLTDTDLNELVDLIYDISESVYLETTSSTEIDAIVSQLSKLNSEELASTIKTMSHLSQEAELKEGNLDRPARFGRSSGSGSPLSMLQHSKGQLLRDYSQLMFSDDVSDSERHIINGHLMGMDYPSAGGLISSARQAQDESKEQLFNLLSERDTKELLDVFSYLGDLSNKSVFLTQYEIEDENGHKELATVFEPNDGESQQILVQSLLSVLQENGLDAVNGYIEQLSKSGDQVQSNVWQKIATNVGEVSDTLTIESVSFLLAQSNEEVAAAHDMQMKSDFNASYPGGSIINTRKISAGKW